MLVMTHWIYNLNQIAQTLSLCDRTTTGLVIEPVLYEHNPDSGVPGDQVA
jgi:hypothetical protein